MSKHSKTKSEPQVTDQTEGSNTNDQNVVTHTEGNLAVAPTIEDQPVTSQVAVADQLKYDPEVLASHQTKSAKIRYLASCNMKVSEIAKTLGIIYQHARNVLKTPLKGKPAA